MFKRRDLIVTATVSDMLENLRLALEVLKGSRIRFKHFHLDRNLLTGHGAFSTNEQIFQITFIKDREDLMSLKVDDVWYTARFDNPGEVHVIQTFWDQPYTVRRQIKNWLVGTSFVDRREEPLFR